jgi:hypothetical protein
MTTGPPPPRAQEAIASLETSCELANPSQIESFLDAVQTLRAVHHPMLLRRMVCALRDGEHAEVQLELVSACETYPPAELLEALVEEAQHIHDHATGWAIAMLHSLLSLPACRQQLLALAEHLTPEQLAPLADWARDVAHLEPLHSRLAEHLETLAT